MRMKNPKKEVVELEDGGLTNQECDQSGQSRDK